MMFLPAMLRRAVLLVEAMALATVLGASALLVLILTAAL